MFAQTGKEEEVRNIYQRASTIFVPIALPEIRLHYAYFEEMSNRIDIAKDIHEAILVQLPSHVETIVSLANTSRRHGTIDDAIAVYKAQLANTVVSTDAKATLVSEWAKLLWKIKNTPDEGRSVFARYQTQYSDSDAFWKGWLSYEIGLPNNHNVKAVVSQILSNPKLLERQALVTMYMAYLLERGDKESTKEYLALDRDIFGPNSVKKPAGAMVGFGKANGR